MLMNTPLDRAWRQLPRINTPTVGRVSGPFGLSIKRPSPFLSTHSHSFKHQSFPFSQLTMPSWTHLVRFEAEEDGRVHLGQLADTSRDVGLDSLDGKPIKAYRLNGDMYTGSVSKQLLTVRKVNTDIDAASASVPSLMRTAPVARGG